MNAVAFEPWLVCGSGHPGRDVGFLEQMRFLVGYAILAPSPHNAQPWYFRALKERIGVHIDRTRVLKFCDPHDREATIGCGCAIFNLCLAIRHFGNAAVGELLPDAAQPDLLAAIGIGDRRNADHECNSLFEAIPKRRTNRLKFETRAPDAAFLEKLEQIARADGAWLHVVRGRQMRHALAELIAEGDRFQWHDVRFRRELAGWVHSNRSDSHDGMPGYAFGHGDVQSLLDPFVIRTFDLAERVATRDLDAAEHSPALLVLGTAEDSPRSWLHAGRALQHILLQAAAGGLSCSYFNQPLQVDALRPKVTAVIGRTGHAQVIMRMGFGGEVRPTPRRSVSEVIRP